MSTLKLIPTSKSSKCLIPEFATENSACFDIKADLNDRVVRVMSSMNIGTTFNIKPQDGILELPPEYRALIPTGFIFEIPDGYSMRLHPRSGFGWKYGVTLMNAEGVIDWDYPNETFIMLHNTSFEPFRIIHGTRIAQGEIVKRQECKFELVDESHVFQNTSDRTGGFGSTGNT